RLRKAAGRQLRAAAPEVLRRRGLWRQATGAAGGAGVPGHRAERAAQGEGAQGASRRLTPEGLALDGFVAPYLHERRVARVPDRPLHLRCDAIDRLALHLPGALLSLSPNHNRASMISRS